MTVKPSTAPLGRAPILPPVVSAQLSARSDRLVRDIVSSFPMIDPRGWEDAQVSMLRVLVGVAMHDGAGLGMLHVYAAQRAREAPLATTKIDPTYDADATTKPIRRRPDLGDE